VPSFPVREPGQWFTRFRCRQRWRLGIRLWNRRMTPPLRQIIFLNRLLTQLSPYKQSELPFGYCERWESRAELDGRVK